MNPQSASPQDEAAIRELYRAMLDSWAAGDAAAYADQFTDDADYIIASGVLEKGRAAMIAGHQSIFDVWAKGSRLSGRIHSIRWLTPDVALVIATGTIIMPQAPQHIDLPHTTIYSLTALRTADGWRFTAYQNTPIEREPDC